MQFNSLFLFILPHSIQKHCISVLWHKTPYIIKYTVRCYSRILFRCFYFLILYKTIYCFKTQKPPSLQLPQISLNSHEIVFWITLSIFFPISIVCTISIFFSSMANWQYKYLAGLWRTASLGHLYHRILDEPVCFY